VVLTGKEAENAMSDVRVQIAVDTTSVIRARELSDAALAAGADWIEIGKPLVEFEGLNGVRELVQDLSTRTYVLLDIMIIAAADRYVAAAAAMGAHNVTVSALAPETTVLEAIEAGVRHGVDITVDLFNVADPVAAARRYERAPFLMVHFGVDQKRAAPDGSPIRQLADVVAAVDTAVSYATYDLTESRAAVAAGASVIVQGEPLLSAADPASAFAEFISATHEIRNGSEQK